MQGAQGSRAHMIEAAIEKAYKPTAEEKKTVEAGKHGAEGGRGKKKTLRGSFPKGKQDESSRTTAVAAAAVGMDRRTYEKAKEVVASGQEPGSFTIRRRRSGRNESLLILFR